MDHLGFRTVHIDYEFTYKGTTYSARHVDTGADSDTKRIKPTEYRPSAIFHALGDDYDVEWCEKTFGTLCPGRGVLRANGFVFTIFEVYY